MSGKRVVEAKRGSVAVARLTDRTGLLEESLELTDNAGIDEMVAVA